MLETWADSYTEQAELARAVSAHGAAVKLILCGTGGATEDLVISNMQPQSRSIDTGALFLARTWFKSA